MGTILRLLPILALTTTPRSLPIRLRHRLKRNQTCRGEKILAKFGEWPDAAAAEYKGRIEEAASQKGIAGKLKIRGTGNTLTLSRKTSPFRTRRAS